MTFQGEFQLAHTMAIEPCTGLYENILTVVSQDTTQVTDEVQARGLLPVELQKILDSSVPNAYMYVRNGKS
jgi:type VI protein secretion system component Hcp